MAEWLKDFASAGLKMKTLSVLLVVFGNRFEVNRQSTGSEHKISDRLSTR
jgi:hypothetical protein